MKTFINAREVERLHHALGGDPVTEEMILRFIGARWEAMNLFYLPPKVAAEALRRPVDFLRAAKEYCQPELDLKPLMNTDGHGLLTGRQMERRSFGVRFGAGVKGRQPGFEVVISKVLQKLNRIFGIGF